MILFSVILFKLNIYKRMFNIKTTSKIKKKIKRMEMKMRLFYEK